MKKLLILLLLPVFGFGQNLVDIHYFTIENFGTTQPNDFNDSVFKFERGDIFPDDPYDTRVEKLTVPDGKYWKIVHCQHFNQSSSANNYFRGRQSTIVNVPELVIYNRFFDPLKNENYGTTNPRYSYTKYDTTNPFFLSPGTIFTIGNTNIALIVVYEYTIDDSNSLSSNYPENIQNSNTPILFPNPTSSLLALNSDKDYDIEVYDMLGNKLMALTGNSINMEHLSTATYIVKATDKSNNEELTYKVVKN